MTPDLTVREVAEQLNLHPATVRVLLARGALAGYKAGRRSWRIPVASLDEFRDSGPAPPESPAVPRVRRRSPRARSAAHQRALAELMGRG